MKPTTKENLQELAILGLCFLLPVLVVVKPGIEGMLTFAAILIGCAAAITQHFIPNKPAEKIGEAARLIILAGLAQLLIPVSPNTPQIPLILGAGWLAWAALTKTPTQKLEHNKGLATACLLVLWMGWCNLPTPNPNNLIFLAVTIALALSLRQPKDTKILGWIITLNCLFVLLLLEPGNRAQNAPLVFTHKNHIAVAGIIALGIMMTNTGTINTILQITCSGILLVGHSATGQIGCAILWSWKIAGYWLQTKNPKTQMITWGAIAAATAGAALFAEPILSLLGKKTSLTGRVPLWTTALDWVPLHPILGAGGTFWEFPGKVFGQNHIQFQAGNAHNGFLQMLTNYGAIGLGLFLLTLTLSACQTNLKTHQKALILAACITPLLTEAFSFPTQESGIIGIWLAACLIWISPSS